MPSPPTPAPTVKGAPKPIAIANTMTGFTKATFTDEYQLAFRTATAYTLKVALAKVALGPVTNFNVALRRLLGRSLAETTSIKFDTIITLTKKDAKDAPTILADIKTKATAMADDPTELIIAFEAVQAREGIAVITPTITVITPTITARSSAADGDEPQPTPVSYEMAAGAAAGAVLLAALWCFISRRRFSQSQPPPTSPAVQKDKPSFMRENPMRVSAEPTKSVQLTTHASGSNRVVSAAL